MHLTVFLFFACLFTSISTTEAQLFNISGQQRSNINMELSDCKLLLGDTVTLNWDGKTSSQTDTIRKDPIYVLSAMKTQYGKTIQHHPKPLKTDAWRYYFQNKGVTGRRFHRN